MSINPIDLPKILHLIFDYAAYDLALNQRQVLSTACSNKQV